MALKEWSPNSKKLRGSLVLSHLFWDSIEQNKPKLVQILKKKKSYLQSELKGMVGELIYEVKYQISARP